MINYPIELSEQILNNLKLGQDTKALRRELFYVRVNKLNSYLYNDDLKKRFWINIYNAYFLLLKNEAKVKKKTFDVKRIKVGNNRISLNDIEYRIIKNKGLRNYWGIANLFDPPFIKKVAVQKTDQNSVYQLDKYNR
jgi:hypothetical protein